jgi:lipopolysaccharide/colanic/teichoic acid biosynthesis glycosyltransferase
MKDAGTSLLQRQAEIAGAEITGAEIVAPAGAELSGGGYRRTGKRSLDILGATVALVLFAPLMAVIAVLVRWRLGSPILFRQERPGRHGEPFVLLKFRTMTDAKDSDGRLRSDSERLTGFGRFLRAASIDELPELLNVLRGEMSLVGPRPLLMEYLPRYTPAQAERHSVRPGITGWAQVNGRNAIGWEQKFSLDLWYTEHLTLLLDLKILWMTCRRVLWRSGVTSEGHATMPEFMGTKSEQ